MMMMLTNKEKRLSQAIPETYPVPDGGPALFNSIQPPNYGLISAGSSNKRIPPPPPPPAPPPIKDVHLKRLIGMEDGGNPSNSHSLNHDFSQLYISKLKNQVHAQTSVAAKRMEINHRSIEEISSYKKETLACKKQMFQMEKSITFWNDCTEYWRNKWRQTRDEKNKLQEEVKQLRIRVNKLEHQLQVSDEKRLRLGDEVTLLNEELSRYMYRFDDDQQQQQQPQNARIKPPPVPAPAHFNSDRRVDYRKKHRRKRSIDLPLKISNHHAHNQHPIGRPNESSTSETDSLRGDLANNHHNVRQHSYTMIPTPLKAEDSMISSPGGSGSLSAHTKIALRHHERLFDHKIMNRKRFSQVVMLDEDEIFQLNKEIPATSTLRSDADTLKVHPDLDAAKHHQRYMDYVPEEDDVQEEEEEDDDEEEDSGRIKPGLFFAEVIPPPPQQPSEENQPSPTTDDDQDQHRHSENHHQHQEEDDDEV